MVAVVVMLWFWLSTSVMVKNGTVGSDVLNKKVAVS